MSDRYESTVRSLESRGVMPERPPALAATQAGLARIGFFEKKFPPERVVVVAGTNGKGSVCATLDELIRSTGARVGLYTSPHLMDTTERIQMQGSPISREAFCEIHDEVAALTEDLHLTHFEMLTLMAVHAFAPGGIGASADWMILEVGLGGLWDSTNAIPHANCVITQLGLDHTAILGPTLGDIARNKLGIIPKNNRSLVAHSPWPNDPGVAAVVEEHKKTTQARWIEAIPMHAAHGSSRLSTPWGDAAFALAGPRGARNTALALTLFDALGFDAGKHLGALGRVRWPGRMQRISVPGMPCPAYASGDHNPQGVQSLLEMLDPNPPPGQRTYFLAGIGLEKNADEMLDLLMDYPGARLALTTAAFRGRRIDGYSSRQLEKAVFYEPDPMQALKRLCAIATSGDAVIVTGSLYLVGQILGALLLKAPSLTSRQRSLP